MWGRESPTVDVILVVIGVFAIQQGLGVLGFTAAWIGLSLPLAVRPWTIVTSVYAHATISHLVTNVVALALIGLVIERVTTRLRYHLFVLGTGVIAGITEVVVNGFLGGSVIVLGVSGAVLALYGYAMTGNIVIGRVLDRINLDRRAQAVLFLALALGVTVLTAASGVAVIAHFTGFLIGLIAGRIRLLHVTA